MVRTSTLYFIKFKESNILFTFSPIPCNESWHLSRCNLEWSISFLLHFLEWRGKLVSTIKAGLQDRSLFPRFLIYSKGKYNGEPPSIWRKSSDVALINCKKERVAIASVDYGKGACSKRSRWLLAPIVRPVAGWRWLSGSNARSACGGFSFCAANPRVTLIWGRRRSIFR